MPPPVALPTRTPVLVSTTNRTRRWPAAGVLRGELRRAAYTARCNAGVAGRRAFSQGRASLLGWLPADDRKASLRNPPTRQVVAAEPAQQLDVVSQFVEDSPAQLGRHARSTEIGIGPSEAVADGPHRMGPLLLNHPIGDRPELFDPRLARPVEPLVLFERRRLQAQPLEETDV